MTIKKLFNINIGIITVNLLFIPTVIFSFIFNYQNLFFVSFLSVLIHEFAHILCARLVGVGISHIEIHPFGVCAVLKDGYINNSEKEFLIAFWTIFYKFLRTFIFLNHPIL